MAIAAATQCDPSAVADAMLTRPKTMTRAATVADARAAFRDGHVHALLVVDGGVLVAVVERPDLDGVPDPYPAWRAGRIAGRTVAPGADLQRVWHGMRAAGRRRIAVVDEHGVLHGLLCLKRSEQGFCTDAGVAARARERDAGGYGRSGEIGRG